MTREEIIKGLYHGDSKAIKEAISALSAEGEYIKKEDAIKAIQKYGIGSFDLENYTAEQAERYVINSLDSLPTYSFPEREKGEWIAEDIHNCCTEFKCSKCGYMHNFTHLYGIPTADYPYCPNCGADMRGKAE